MRAARSYFSMTFLKVTWRLLAYHIAEKFPQNPQPVLRLLLGRLYALSLRDWGCRLLCMRYIPEQAPSADASFDCVSWQDSRG